MIRRVVAASVVLFAALAVVPLGVAHAATAKPTVVVRLSPVTASGQLRAGYTITHRQGHASCQSGSEATGDAYRCFAGDGVFDPCWVTANKSYVDCLPAPYGHKVARLHVTKGYDNEGGLGHAATLPWGLQVASGKRATLLQGATSTVAGKRINYSLKGFSDVLIGRVNKHHAVWRIREARRTAGHYKVTGWIDLSTAWFGVRSLKG